MRHLPNLTTPGECHGVVVLLLASGCEFIDVQVEGERAVEGVAQNTNFTKVPSRHLHRTIEQARVGEGNE